MRFLQLRHSKQRTPATRACHCTLRKYYLMEVFIIGIFIAVDISRMELKKKQRRNLNCYDNNVADNRVQSVHAVRLMLSSFWIEQVFESICRKHTKSDRVFHMNVSTQCKQHQHVYSIRLDVFFRRHLCVAMRIASECHICAFWEVI